MLFSQIVLNRLLVFSTTIRLHQRISALVVAIFALSQSAAIYASNATLTIAVASNFKSTLEELVIGFNLNNDASVRISPSSTGILYAQIVSGAPFDIFLAADVLRPKHLVENRLAVGATRFTYARGQLILWVPGQEKVRQSTLTETAGRISLANPDIAPYGLAARQYLQGAGLWNQLEPRLVFGSNVAQAFQHIVSGNAQAGLTSLSLLEDFKPERPASGIDYWLVPSHLYTPIDQQGVILERTTNRELAAEFLAFMQSAQAHQIISQNGYLLPSRNAGK